MNNRGIKKLIWSVVFIVFFALTVPGFAAEQDGGQVKMSWLEFRKLLKLDSDDVTLTWEEFKQLTAQTGEDVPVSYTVKNGKIVLPREQFTQLLNKMKPPVGTILQAPGEFVINKAVYKADMSNSGTVVNAVFSLEIFPKKNRAYSRVPFLHQAVGLAEVLLDDKPALVIEENGWYQVATTEVGHHQIKVKYYTASNLEKGPQILSMQVIKTAITLFELTVPLEKVDINVTFAKELTINSRPGMTQISAVLPATNVIMVQAHRKYIAQKTTAVDTPAKIYAETMNLISIEEDALRVTSRIKLNVMQNSITQIKATVPEGYTILYIQKMDGSRLRDWQIKKSDTGTGAGDAGAGSADTAGGAGSVVEIPFDAPVEGSFMFDIISERLTADKQQDIPFDGFGIMDAVRETGYIGAEKKSTAEAAPTVNEKLDRIDIKDLPYDLVNMSHRPLLFGYRYLRHPYKLVMSITKHEELPTMSTVIDMAGVISVVLEDGKILTRMNYTIRNTWKQFLKLDLPPDSEVWTVYVDGKRENASRSADGKIMIPLARSQSEGDVLKSFTLEVIYFSKGHGLGMFGSSSVAYPTADIMTSKMLWSVYLPRDYAYLHFKGDVEKEEIANTVNLLFGKSRNFSLDQISSYNEVAVNLEKAPHQQLELNKYQQSISSNFKNSAIQQKDLAVQMRQEANLNMDFQREQGKQLGQPGSGGDIFKIELPTSGQIYRFNKTVIEGEPILLTFYYTSNLLKTVIKIVFLLLVLLLLFLLRKKIFGVFKKMYQWVVSRHNLWAYIKTAPGLRWTLFVFGMLFLFVSHVVFVVLALLFIMSIFRPWWLLPGVIPTTSSWSPIGAFLKWRKKGKAEGVMSGKTEKDVKDEKDSKDAKGKVEGKETEGSGDRDEK